MRKRHIVVDTLGLILTVVVHAGNLQDRDGANTALNCSLITWRTNRTIGAQEPVQYLKERTEASSLGEEAIKRRLASHTVSFEALAKGNYYEFRVARAEVFEGAIKKLCSGEHWDPAN